MSAFTIILSSSTASSSLLCVLKTWLKPVKNFPLLTTVILNLIPSLILYCTSDLKCPPLSTNPREQFDGSVNLVNVSQGRWAEQGGRGGVSPAYGEEAEEDLTGGWALVGS